MKAVDLARGIGARQSKVSRWLKCTATPNAVSIVKIADYLNASLDELYERSPPGADPRPQIRKHAQAIFRLAGGAAEPKAKKKKAKRGKKAVKRSGAMKRKKKGKRGG